MNRRLQIPSDRTIKFSGSTSLRGSLLPWQSRLYPVYTLAGFLRASPRDDEKKLNLDNLTALPSKGDRCTSTYNLLLIQ